MILTAEFEGTETVPPVAWGQCRRALAHVLESYGFKANIRENRESELDAHARYWQWRAEEREKAPK